MVKVKPADMDFLPDKIVPDPQSPPPGVVVLWGFLGKAALRAAAVTTNGPAPGPAPAGGPAPAPVTTDVGAPADTFTYVRLYRSLLFNEYIEFNEADLIHYEKVSFPDVRHLTGAIVWLKEGATIQYVQTQALELQRGFLQGDIAGSAAGQPGMPGGAGGSFLCNAAGLGAGGGGGAGGSFMCTGPNMPGSFLCGGGGGSFLCGGAGGSFMCNGAGGSFLCGGAGGSFVFC